jgi:DNA-binding MarR family transcriptional regulator
MAPAARGSAGIDVTASTGHLIRRAAQRYSAIWADLSPGDLTSPQFGLLALLDSEGELDQQTLGQRGALDKSTCGYLVDRMQRAGLVNSVTDPTNRRRKLISLTGAGRTRLREAAPLQQQVQAMALSELTEQDRLELNRLLTKMLSLGPPVDAEQ